GALPIWPAAAPAAGTGRDDDDGACGTPWRMDRPPRYRQPATRGACPSVRQAHAAPAARRFVDRLHDAHVAQPLLARQPRRAAFQDRQREVVQLGREQVDRWIRDLHPVTAATAIAVVEERGIEFEPAALA